MGRTNVRKELPLQTGRHATPTRAAARNAFQMYSVVVRGVMKHGGNSPKSSEGVRATGLRSPVSDIQSIESAMSSHRSDARFRLMVMTGSERRLRVMVQSLLLNEFKERTLSMYSVC